MNEVFDFLSRPAPEDETMSWIYVAWFDSRVMQLEQDGVDADSWEVIVQHLSFLLRVSCRSMKRILGLNSSLHS